MRLGTWNPPAGSSCWFNPNGGFWDCKQTCTMTPAGVWDCILPERPRQRTEPLLSSEPGTSELRRQDASAAQIRAGILLAAAAAIVLWILD